MKNILFKLLALTLFVGLTSCEKDFLNVNSDVKGAQNFKIATQEFPVTAFTKPSGPVQANGLPTVFLGAFKDDTYNTTTVSNVIAELVPTTFSPDLGTNPRIDSVHVYVPYFSTLTEASVNGGKNKYDLEAIIGAPSTTYKLTVLKSNYLLRDLDPATNFQEQQVYYTDFYSTTLEAADDSYTTLFEDTMFEPNSEEIVLRELGDMGAPTGDPVRVLPALRLDLYTGNEAYWNDLMGLVVN